MSAADVLASVRPSVVRIDVEDESGQLGTGSGVFVSEDGQVLTCYHVIADARTATCRLADGREAPIVGFVAGDREQDWAVLKCSITAPQAVVLGDASTLRQGDRVFTLGTPLGLDMTASDGMVSSIRHVPGLGLHLQITAPASPGSSGGPVLDEDGNVVGITAFGIREGQNLNFAVSANTVRAGWTGEETPRPLAAVFPPETANTTEIPEMTAVETHIEWIGVVVTPQGKGVNFRTEPSNKASRVPERNNIPDGTHLRILSREGDWLRVIEPGGRAGWVRWTYEGAVYVTPTF